MAGQFSDRICMDTRPCFARGDFRGCSILIDPYKHDGECPFCKQHRAWTKGKYYPVDKRYGSVKKPVAVSELEGEGNDEDVLSGVNGMVFRRHRVRRSVDLY